MIQYVEKNIPMLGWQFRDILEIFTEEFIINRNYNCVWRNYKKFPYRRAKTYVLKEQRNTFKFLYYTRGICVNFSNIMQFWIQFTTEENAIVWYD
jgi:hypothetical protein